MVKFYACIWEILRGSRGIGECRVSAERRSRRYGDRGNRGATRRPIPSDATPRVPVRPVAPGSGHSGVRSRRSSTAGRIDARHAGYVDGKWERP